MGIRRLSLALPALIALAALFALAGCGDTSSQRPLRLGEVPLVPGAKVVRQLTQCDRGANAYCAIEAVLVDRRFASSGAFVKSEIHRLRALGWKSSAGDDGVEAAANSPNQQLRLTFATALNDLIGIELRWIRRGMIIPPALDHTIINQTPAMSVLLEVGPE